MASYFCLPCKACCKCSEVVCEGCLSPCCPDHRPSPIFLGYTLLLNVVPAIVGVVIAALATAGEGSKCSTSSDELLRVFMFVAAGCSFFFALFAIRAYFVLRPNEHEVHESGDHTGFGRFLASSQCGRFKKFWKKDPFVFLYILFAPFAFVWSILGLVWADAVKKDYINKYSNVESIFSQDCFWVMIRMSKAQASILLIYICLSPIVIAFSWCVESYRAGRRRKDVEHGQVGMYINQAPPPIATPMTKAGASGPSAVTAPPIPASVVGHGSYGHKG